MKLDKVYDYVFFVFSFRALSAELSLLYRQSYSQAQPIARLQ